MNCWNSSGISEEFQRFHLFQSFSSHFPWLQWNSTGIPPERWKDFLVGIYISFIFLDCLFHFQVDLLLNNVYNLQIQDFVLWHTFLWPLLFCFYFCCLLNSYMFLVSMRQILSLFSHIIHLSLIQLLFYFSLK